MKKLSHEFINSCGVVFAVLLGGASFALSWSDRQAKLENIVSDVTALGGDYDSQIENWLIARKYRVLFSNISESDTSIVSIKAAYRDSSVQFILDQAFFDHKPFLPVNVSAGTSVAVDVTLPFPIPAACQFREIAEHSRPVSISSIRQIYEAHGKIFPGCSDANSTQFRDFNIASEAPTNYRVLARTGKGLNISMPTYFWSE